MMDDHQGALWPHYHPGIQGGFQNLKWASRTPPPHSNSQSLLKALRSPLLGPLGSSPRSPKGPSSEGLFLRGRMEAPGKG